VLITSSPFHGSWRSPWLKTAPRWPHYERPADLSHLSLIEVKFEPHPTRLRRLWDGTLHPDRSILLDKTPSLDITTPSSAKVNLRPWFTGISTYFESKCVTPLFFTLSSDILLGYSFSTRFLRLQVNGSWAATSGAFARPMSQEITSTLHIPN